MSALTVEPVGRWYEAYALRHLHKHSLSYNSLTSSSSDDNDSELSQDEEDEDNGLLLTLDPKDWKVRWFIYLIFEFFVYINSSVSNIELVPLHTLIQRPVHQSVGLVKRRVGLVKNGVFGGNFGSCDLINWIIFSFLLF